MKSNQKGIERLKELIIQKIANIHSDRCGLSGTRKGVLAATVTPSGTSLAVHVQTTEGATRHGIDYDHGFAFESVYSCHVYCEDGNVGMSHDYMKIDTDLMKKIAVTQSEKLPMPKDEVTTISLLVSCKVPVCTEVHNAIEQVEMEMEPLSELEVELLNNMNDNYGEKLNYCANHSDVRKLLIIGYANQGNHGYVITKKGLKFLSDKKWIPFREY